MAESFGEKLRGIFFGYEEFSSVDVQLWTPEQAASQGFKKIVPKDQEKVVVAVGTKPDGSLVARRMPEVNWGRFTRKGGGTTAGDIPYIIEVFDEAHRRLGT